MREIKFRSNNRIGNFLYSSEFNSLAEYFSECDTHGWECQEQYTGKNATVEKKPIFEGDILKDPIHDRPGTYLFVYWDEEYASFRAKNKSVNYGLLGLHNTEIVGNVHENEGLL